MWEVEGQQQPVYSGYPRPQLQLDIEKLELLRDAYFGCQWLIPATLGVGIVGSLLAAAVASALSSAELDATGGVLILGTIATIVLVDWALCHRYAAMVAKAKGRGAWYTGALAIGAALAAPWCFGLLACALIQQEAGHEFKRLGFRPGFLGLRRADIQVRIDEARRAQAALPYQMP